MKDKGHKNRDINIDINIENNLMSKNKQLMPKGEQKPQENERIVLPEYTYNHELPRVVNEYYALLN